MHRIAGASPASVSDPAHGFPMHNFEDIEPGDRLLGLDPAGITEVVQIARFGPDALNLVFGWMAELASASSIAERKTASSLSNRDGATPSTPMAACYGWRPRRTASGLPIFSIPISPLARPRSKRYGR